MKLLVGFFFFFIDRVQSFAQFRVTGSSDSQLPSEPATREILAGSRFHPGSEIESWIDF